MNIRNTFGVLGASLLLTAMAQAGALEDFENGNPNNWHMDWNGTYNGYPIVEMLGTHQASGGNPGGYLEYTGLQVQVDVWFFQAGEGNPDWTGDFRAKGVDHVSFDFRHNAGTSPFGMVLLVVFADDMGTPEVTDDIMVVGPYDAMNYSFAGMGAAIQMGVWTPITWDVPVDSPTLPAGWTIQGLGGTYGTGNDDADWNSVMTSVDYVAIVNGSPWGGFTLGTVDVDFDNMTLGPDNVGIQYCAGDGVAPHTPCPAANNNDGSMGGCDWGDLNFPGGGLLYATGSDDLTAADTYLVAENVENDFGVFFGGNNLVNSGNGNPLNDGLRCAGGALVRLIPPTIAANNTLTAGPVQLLDTGATLGTTRYYQYWFRSPNGPGGQMANLTNGLEINW